jgi:hypothetical protein
MAVRLSSFCAGRPLPPRRFLVLISVRGWIDTGNIDINYKTTNFVLLALIIFRYLIKEQPPALPLCLMRSPLNAYTHRTLVLHSQVLHPWSMLGLYCFNKAVGPFLIILSLLLQDVTLCHFSWRHGRDVISSSARSSNDKSRLNSNLTNICTLQKRRKW